LNYGLAGALIDRQDKLRPGTMIIDKN
jgi:hypothetical protein